MTSSTHKAAPKPADLKITVENYEGECIEYNTAWRKLQEVNDLQEGAAAEAEAEAAAAAAVKSFELSIPFFQEWKEMNPRSVVDWKVDDDGRIKHIFVCPYYTDQVLVHCSPVVSVDEVTLQMYNFFSILV